MGNSQFFNWISNRDREQFLVYIQNELGVKFKKYVSDPEDYEYRIPSQLLEVDSIQPLIDAFTSEEAKKKNMFRVYKIYTMDHWTLKLDTHEHYDVSGKDFDDYITAVSFNKVYDKIRHMFHTD